MPPPSADQLDVGSEQLPHSVDVAIAERIEEPRGQLLAFPAVRLEPGAPDSHVASRADSELAARRLRPPDGNCDLGKAESEHLPEHEDRPLQRGQPLKQQQGRHRHRIRQLRRPRRILIGVGEQRLGEPLPDVRLPPDTRRPQHIDRDPRDHG